ncbi:AraC family transcriptional regulator [Planctomicrobium sp. SH664]|uniref:AraC family transcriptional regulator n=1 Tax=Planctomicrobium sp. SH664 TaxID=3448125 RepID=UPI003F5AE7DB
MSFSRLAAADTAPDTTEQFRLNDPLSAVLNQLPVRCQMTGKQTLHEREHGELFPEFPCFQFVTAGQALFAPEKDRRFQLRVGDLLILLRSPTTSPGDSTLFALEPGEIYSGRLDCAGDRLPPLFDALPAVLHVSAHDQADPLSGRLLQEARTALQSEQPGTSAIVNQLLSLVVLQSIRISLQTLSPLESGWIQGLRDAELGPIFALMLQYPERIWTIESLAAAGHLPRSTFARRFRQVVGEPPMNVLTVIRMQTACRLLQSSLGLKDVARQAGYRSLSAFCAVFQRWSGLTPQAFRKSRHRDQGEVSEPALAVVN